VQLSLHTKNLKEAKKLRALRDVEWDAKFAACSSPVNGGAGPAVQTSALAACRALREALRLTRQ
jgi:hypothetical protein